MAERSTRRPRPRRTRPKRQPDEHVEERADKDEVTEASEERAEEDEVTEASMESFPASDPPAWIAGSATEDHQDEPLSEDEKVPQDPAEARRRRETSKRRSDGG